MEMLNYKSISAAVKDIDAKNRIITGYLSNFGNKDHDGDVIEKGAFKRSIQQRKSQIFFLNQHNWAEPHGKFRELKEDDKGLYFESEPLLDTTYSNDVLKLYDAGVMNQHSIGFQVVKSEGEWGDRVIKEIKLWEGSNVTLGANPETPFTGFKSGVEELNEIQERQKVLYKAIRNGDFTDETFVLLEYELNALISKAHQIGINSTQNPEVSTFDPLPTLDKFINELKTA